MQNLFLDKHTSHCPRLCRKQIKFISILLALIFLNASISTSRAEQRTIEAGSENENSLGINNSMSEPWKNFLVLAYDAVNSGNKKRAFQFLHKAFEALNLSNPSDRSGNVSTLLKESVKIYRKFDDENAASQISKLLLTPATTANQDAFLKAKLIQKRKRNLLLAGDKANYKDDYFLADLFYCSLLAGPSVYENINTRGHKESEYQTKVVDRLVRLYLEHKDIDRAENLVNTSKQRVLFTAASQIDEILTKRRLAMLEIDMALVKFHRKDYKASVSIFKKNIIKLERLFPRQKGQLATIYNDYALACDRLGKRGEAKRQYKRALAIANKKSTVSEKTRQVIEKNYQKFLDRHK